MKITIPYFDRFQIFFFFFLFIKEKTNYDFASLIIVTTKVGCALASIHRLIG